MKSTIERFLNKIKIDDNGCWEWKYAKCSGGYGFIRINNKNILTHRYIYEYYHGMICPDLTIDHLCRNRACVNPKHLEQVSMQENLLRGFGVGVMNAKKTHCIHGHEFTKENTHVSATGKRGCKTCILYRTNKYNHQRKMLIQ